MHHRASSDFIGKEAEQVDDTLTPPSSYHLAGKCADLGTVHCGRSKANPSLEHQWQYLANLKMHLKFSAGISWLHTRRWLCFACVNHHSIPPLESRAQPSAAQHM